jgi:hypothetical protein
LSDLNLSNVAGQIASLHSSFPFSQPLEFIDVPVLFVGRLSGFVAGFGFSDGRSAVALTPDLANAQFAGGHLLMPRQYGPRDGAGDIFESAVYGILPNAVFIDDWDAYHIHTGEVHCGTNVKRSRSRLIGGPRQRSNL